MKKWLILSTIFLIFIGISFYFFFQKGEVRILEVLKKEVISPVKKEVTVAYGWSVKNETIEAVEEALKPIKEVFKDTEPEYIILFSTPTYELEKVIERITTTFPHTQIYGGTSMLAVMTKDGFHMGEKGSLAMMAISSPFIDFGVGGAEVNENLLPKEVGRIAILEAMKNAGRENEKPDIILMTGSVGNEEKMIEGIEEVVGKDVPIIGGSGADNDISGKWRQFANGRIYKNGLSLTAIYTDLRIGWTFEAGYLRSKKEGTITNASGRVIYEIDGRPAAEVYNEWTNGIVSEELEKGGKVLSKTTFYPLAKIIKGENKVYYLSIHPLSVNLPEKSLTVFANVKSGEEVMLLQGTWEILLNRAQTTPSLALVKGDIGKDEGYFAIYTFCAGTMLAIPEKERYKMPVLIRNTIGDVPFIGTFTFGEQGLLEGVGNHHGNLVNSMVIFGPK